MSGGLVPSKSTVYISNLPFNLKNNDLHKLFEQHGKIVKITIVKDRARRQSKGVAFILYLNADDARKCVAATHLKETFGRTLKASIAKDNGRSAEFIRRKEYPDKTRCYECGEHGHLSYKCTANVLGERDPPPKRRKRRKIKDGKGTAMTEDEARYFDDDDDDVAAAAAAAEEESLSAAIALDREKRELEDYRYKVATGNYDDDVVEGSQCSSTAAAKRFKKSNYFSDDEDEEDVVDK